MNKKNTQFDGSKRVSYGDMNFESQQEAVFYILSVEFGFNSIDYEPNNDGSFPDFILDWHNDGGTVIEIKGIKGGSMVFTKEKQRQYADWLSNSEFYNCLYIIGIPRPIRSAKHLLDIMRAGTISRKMWKDSFDRIEICSEPNFLMQLFEINCSNNLDEKERELRAMCQYAFNEIKKIKGLGI